MLSLHSACLPAGRFRSSMTEIMVARNDRRYLIHPFNIGAKLIEALRAAEIALAERGIELKEITRALAQAKQEDRQ